MAVFHRKRYYTSILMKTKVCIKPIQNDRILKCMLGKTPFESVFALPLSVIYYF